MVGNIVGHLSRRYPYILANSFIYNVINMVTNMVGYMVVYVSDLRLSIHSISHIYTPFNIVGNMVGNIVGNIVGLLHTKLNISFKRKRLNMVGNIVGQHVIFTDQSSSSGLTFILCKLLIVCCPIGLSLYLWLIDLGLSGIVMTTKPASIEGKRYNSLKE